MLSPEAERVLRYLVEVEELAEAVLADKRQVRDAAAARALRKCASELTRSSGVPGPSGLARSEHRFCAGQSPSFLPAPSLLVPWILTVCGRLP